MVFVVRVELGNGDVEDLEIRSHSSMTAPGLNQNGSTGSEGMYLVVYLDMSLTFEDVVDLRHRLVIVEFTVFLDFDKVKRSDVIRVVHKRTPGLSTGAGSRFDFGESSNLEVLADDFGSHPRVYASETSFERKCFERMDGRT